jgi:MFS family permease
MYGAMIFLPQYMQTVRGASPTASGLRLLPMLAGLLGLSIISGRIVSAYGRYRGFVIGGTAVLAAGILWLSFIRVATSFWVLSAMLLVIGIGLGLFMQIIVLATQNAADERDLGTATSAVTFFRTLGGAIGASVLGAVVLAYSRSNGPEAVAKYGPSQAAGHLFTEGMDSAYLYLVPVAAVAFGLSFLMRDVKLRGPETSVARGGMPEQLAGASTDGDRYDPPAAKTPRESGWMAGLG